MTFFYLPADASLAFKLASAKTKAIQSENVMKETPEKKVDVPMKIPVICHTKQSDRSKKGKEPSPKKVVVSSASFALVLVHLNSF